MTSWIEMFNSGYFNVQEDSNVSPYSSFNRCENNAKHKDNTHLLNE